MKDITKSLRITVTVDGINCCMCKYRYDSCGILIPHCGLFHKPLKLDKDDNLIRCRQCIRKFGKDGGGSDV